jgi:hypothetical protein
MDEIQYIWTGLKEEQYAQLEAHGWCCVPDIFPGTGTANNLGAELVACHVPAMGGGRYRVIGFEWRDCDSLRPRASDISLTVRITPLLVSYL